MFGDITVEGGTLTLSDGRNLALDTDPERLRALVDFLWSVAAEPEDGMPARFISGQVDFDFDIQDANNNLQVSFVEPEDDQVNDYLTYAQTGALATYLEETL